MKRRKIVLAVTLVVALLITIIPIGLMATAEGEISIASYEDLQKIGTDMAYPLSGTYKLTGNITVGESDADFIPIGTEESPFTGSFDGQKYSISGLKITGTNTTPIKHVGLFGYVSSGAEISNLTIINSQFVNIDKGQVKTVGFIAGYNEGTIENCAASKSTTSIEIQMSDTTVGGIAGTNKGSILKCYNTSDILIKTLSFYTSLQAGGIVGFNEIITSEPVLLATITDCFNTGAVVVNSNNPLIPVGGIAGKNKGTIARTYNAGIVRGVLNVGGITGDQSTENGSSATNSYYHEDTALVQSGNSTDVGSKLTAAQMSVVDNFSTFAANGWSITGSYPYPQLTYTGAITFADTDTASPSNFAGGNGRVYDPYQISSIAHLNNIRNNMLACYKLTSDILFLDWDYQDATTNQAYLTPEKTTALEGLFTELFAGKTAQQYIADDIGFQGAFYNSGARWIPLGVTTQGEQTLVESFCGIFDGSDKTIYNLQVNSGGQGSVYAGLFAINDGTIKDFTIADKPDAADANTLISDQVLKAMFVDGSDVSGVTGSGVIASSEDENAYAGSIVAQNNARGLISSVTSKSKVISISHKAITDSTQYKAYAGGITAVNKGTILNANNQDGVYAYSRSLYAVAGGIAGKNDNGSINTATNTGSVYTSYYLEESETLIDIGFDNIMDKSYFASGGIAGESSKLMNGETEVKLINNAKNLGGVMTQITSNSTTDNFYAGGIVGNGLGAIDETNCYYWEKTASYAVETKPTEYGANKKELADTAFSSITGYDANFFLSFTVPNPPLDGYTIENYQTHLDGLVGTDSTKLYNNSETDISIDVSKSYAPSSKYVLVKVEATETEASKIAAGRVQALTASVDFFITLAAPDDITSSTYEVEDVTIGGENKKIITDVSTATTVEQFKANINEGQFVQICKNGIVQANTATVGTGFVVKIMDGETVKQEFTVIIKGDIAGGGSTGMGDGRISVLDLAQIKEHLLQRSTLTGIAFIASDMNDSNGISALDYGILKEQFLNG